MLRIDRRNDVAGDILSLTMTFWQKMAGWYAYCILLSESRNLLSEAEAIKRTFI